MGFRSGAWAKVWEVTPVSDACTKIRISVSQKNKQTGEYEQDFSGFVMCAGTAVAKKACALNKGDTIKLGDCDVSTKYDKQREVTYTNFKLFSFEEDTSEKAPRVDEGEPPFTVGSGEVDDSDLPY